MVAETASSPRLSDSPESGQPCVFVAEDRFHLPRGLLFTGVWPIKGRINKGGRFQDWSDYFVQPWIVLHPSVAPGALWRIAGIETFATAFLSRGQRVGLLVRPWLS